jgi:hypothetical protein
VTREPNSKSDISNYKTIVYICILCNYMWIRQFSV